MSLALGQRHPILDGNVKRVLARYFVVEGWPGRAGVLRQLWELAETHTPTKGVAAYNQALMDLGAMICTRSRPHCRSCPLAAGCQAFRQQRQADFPTAKPRKQLVTRRTRMLLIHRDNELLLQQRPPSGIWGGLWSFPECTVQSDTTQWCLHNLSLKVGSLEKLATRRHTFSHFHLEIFPVLVESRSVLSRVSDDLALRWCTMQSMGALGLAAPISQLVDEVEKKFAGEGR